MADDRPHLRRAPPLYGVRGQCCYFAYGANLSRTHMRETCPTAEPVGRAVVRDHRLRFCRFADLEPQPGAEAVGVIWRLTRADERALDRFEGFPILYRKETRLAVLETGEAVAVMVYLINRGRRAPPPGGYVAMIRSGYRDFALPEAALDAAVARAFRPLAPPLRR